jgi:hypothetical protein
MKALVSHMQARSRRRSESSSASPGESEPSGTINAQHSHPNLIPSAPSEPGCILTRSAPEMGSAPKEHR